MINQVAQAFAFIFLLAGSFVFGILNKPTEMGFCILASALALAFTNIEKIKRFRGAGFEAEMLEKQVGAMIAKEAEPESGEDKVQSGLTVSAYGLDDPTRAVLNALGNSKYTWRTIDGIAQESGLGVRSVRAVMRWLSLNELVVKTVGTTKTNWGLSQEGRDLYNSIQMSEV